MQSNSISARLVSAVAICILTFGSLPRFSPTSAMPTFETNHVQERAESNSLSQILNPDGTVDGSKTANGSFETKGYRMEYTSDGAPRFVPEVAPDDFWDPQFGENGLNGEITAVATYGSNVYAATCFGTICFVGKWDGNTWSSLGELYTDGVIHGIVVYESSVFIAGEFTHVGPLIANHVAKWNGTGWSALSSGTSGNVYAMSSNGASTFFVVGSFSSAGGVVGTSKIAYWSPSGWGAVGSFFPTTPQVVYAISETPFGSEEWYVGGVDSIGRGTVWKKGDGSSITPLAGNFDLPVRAVAMNGDDVYAGGFNNVNNLPGTKGIAMWNGTSWVSVGGGLSTTDVRTIRVGNGAIYVGGQFATAGTRLVNNVARWNETAWSELGIGTDGPVNALAFPPVQPGVYVGGNFTHAGGTAMNHVANFNATWSPLRSSLNGEVYAVAVLGNDVYVGGSFTSANGVPHTAYFAKWNGTQWSSVGGIDFNGAVNALAVDGNKLYVGGNFTNLGPYFVVWNGNNWSVVCSGSLQGGQVLSIGVSELVPGRVFVGGTFASANGIPGTNFLARCYDSAWFPVGGGVNSVVNSMVTVGADIYMGGAFTSAGGVPGTSRIARWNENGFGTWYAVGSGANNTITSVAKDAAGNIYAGGAFTSMDGVPNTLHIAKWNGSSWSALGSGINGVVWSICVGRGVVYAGGQFTNAGGHAANGVAAWKNGNWVALGSGTNGIVRAVAQRARSVYVGGGFQLAGLKPSYFFGRYRLVDSTPFDFDGDNRSDVSIFRPGPAEWWISRSSDGGNNAYQFGNGSDRIAPADFTGDGKTDVALWRPSTGEWYILRSENSTFYAFPFGTNGDIPMPADYDGDSFADPAIFRPSTAIWYIPMSSNGGAVTTMQFGSAGDRPVAADYDGDSKADVAIFRPIGGSGAAEWWILRSTGGVLAAPFGNSADKTVQGDWTGDGKADIAIWRPGSGQWFIVRSEDSSFYGFPFGTNGDVPVPGDYDGDGRFDAAVFRQPGAQWYIARSSGGTTILNFGQANDVPLESAFIR